MFSHTELHRVSWPTQTVVMEKPTGTRSTLGQWHRLSLSAARLDLGNVFLEQVASVDV